MSAILGFLIVQDDAGPKMSGEIRYLFVTLKRSFAGTRETHDKIVKSLGLRRRQQTVQKPNSASVRGAIDKVLTHSCICTSTCTSTCTSLDMVFMGYILPDR